MASNTYIEYARFADDLVILIDAYKRHDWLVGALDKRLREEFGKLQVEINDEKSRIVDLERSESFGSALRLPLPPQSTRGVAAALHAQAQKADGTGAGAQAVFRRYRSQPIERVINLINPVLRGWVSDGRLRCWAGSRAPAAHGAAISRPVRGRAGRPSTGPPRPRFPGHGSTGCVWRTCHDVGSGRACGCRGSPPSRRSRRSLR
jgi:hypothetical protein